MALDIVVTAGDIAIRRLRDETGDYALLVRWLSDECVLEFVERRDNSFDVAKARAEYGSLARGEGGEIGCIVECTGTPLGYVQYYPLTLDDAEYYMLNSVAGVYALDLFIGEPSEWNKRLGTCILTAMSDFLFREKHARRIDIDPRVENVRAIRVYEKAGFRRVQVLLKREWHEGVLHDCLLMVKDVQ